MYPSSVSNTHMVGGWRGRLAPILLLAMLACSSPAPSVSTAGGAASPQGATGLRDGETFRDCADCPDMIVIPAGSFVMGSPADEAQRGADEGPQRRVNIERFAASRTEITFAQWDSCAAAGGCDDEGPHAAGGDNGWGRGRRPVIEINWDDAQQYVRWLSERTGRRYRLLTESEWEYAARAGTTTAFSTGVAVTPSQARYWWSASYAGSPAALAPNGTLEVGSFPANRFGLFDMHGNVWEWIQDCYAPTYENAPTHGAAVETPQCSRRVLRGGSWFDFPQHLRSANRSLDDPTYRYRYFGLRVARNI